MPEKEAKWDERTKFKAETWRTIVLAILGTIAVLLIVKPWEKDIEYRAELDKTRLAIKAKVVDEFLAAAHHYTAIAFDACRAYTKDEALRKTEEKEIIVKFEGEIVDAYRSTMERLEIYFGDEPTIDDKVRHVDTIHRQLFDQCKHQRADEKVWDAERMVLTKANRELAQFALTSVGLRKAQP